MTSLQKKGFITVVILQFLFLTGMILNRTYILKKGKKILLKCEPFDPSSLFSGDYVHLNYEISNLKTADITNYGKKSYYKGEKIYVALEKVWENNFYKGVAISDDADKLNEKFPVIIKGNVKSDYINVAGGGNKYRLSNTHISIKYGIETYYVPQYEGKKIERSLNKVHAQISVMPSGTCALNKLFLNGKQVRFY